MEHLDSQAIHLALVQGGSVSRAQLLELGFTIRQIQYRVSTGRWTAVKRGVYQVARPRDRRDLMRAVVSTWTQSVVSHESAAELHSMPYVEAERVVISNHTRTTHLFPGVEVRRTHDLDEWHITLVDDVRVTTIARTIVDLAPARSVRHIGAIVDRLVSDGRLELLEVEAVLGSTARRGKPGTRTMRAVLEDRIGHDPAESALERHGRELIRLAGLPEPVSEFPVPWSTARRFDDAYPDLRLAVEWDSRRFHGQLASFEADRVRDRDAAVHGWRVVRFTWDDVMNHPWRIADTLRVLVAA